MHSLMMLLALREGWVLYVHFNYNKQNKKGKVIFPDSTICRTQSRTNQLELDHIIMEAGINRRNRCLVALPELDNVFP